MKPAAPVTRTFTKPPAVRAGLARLYTCPRDETRPPAAGPAGAPHDRAGGPRGRRVRLLVAEHRVPGRDRARLSMVRGRRPALAGHRRVLRPPAARRAVPGRDLGRCALSPECAAAVRAVHRAAGVPVVADPA